MTGETDRTFPFTDDLSAEARARLRDAVSLQVVPAGADILHPGDAVEGAYLVRAGALRVYYVDAKGHEGTLYWIEPGESCILALNSLFSDMPYPAFAAAEGKGAEILHVPGTMFRELFTVEPAVQRFLFDQLSGRVFGLLQLLEERMRLPQEGRLVSLLLAQSDDAGVVKLSQEQIAGHLGTSREVVSRLLRNLASERLVDTAPRRIALLNRERLTAMVEDA